MPWYKLDMESNIAAIYIKYYSHVRTNELKQFFYFKYIYLWLSIKPDAQHQLLQRCGVDFQIVTFQRNAFDVVSCTIRG